MENIQYARETGKCVLCVCVCMCVLYNFSFLSPSVVVVISLVFCFALFSQPVDIDSSSLSWVPHRIIIFLDRLLAPHLDFCDFIFCQTLTYMKKRLITHTCVESVGAVSGFACCRTFRISFYYHSSCSSICLFAVSLCVWPCENI